MGTTRKAFVLLLILLSLMSLALLPSFTVKAQTRTLTVPDQYPSISSAIENAADGDTILVKAGTYEGPVNTTIVINKSIKLIGDNAQNTIINLYPAYNVTWIFATSQYSYTNALAITASSCVIENLTLNVNTGGFIAAQGNNILIRNNRIITGYYTGVTISGSNCSLTNNNMDGMVRVYGNYNHIDSNNPYGIYLGNVTGNGASFNIIKDNTCQAIGLYYSTNNVILNNSALGYGIEIEWSDNNFLFMNHASSQWGRSVRFWLSSNNTFELNSLNSGSPEFGGAYNNLLALNIFGVSPTDSALDIYDDFSDHNMHTYVSSYSTNIWSQNSLGNYWANYLTKYPNSSEVGHSGVGNMPYVINGNNTDAYPLMPGYNISTASIRLPDWTNLALPAMTIQTPAFQSPQPSSTAMPTIDPTANPIASPTQSPPSAPTSTPTAPELPALAILPLLLSLFAVAIIIKRRKKDGSLS